MDDVAPVIQHALAAASSAPGYPTTAGTPALRASAVAALQRRYGITGLADDELLLPASNDVPVTLAELVFAVTHEGAHDVADLLDRRTRVGLVAADRVAAEPLARRALQLVATGSQPITLG